jgi:hypothetical protein
LAVGWRVAAHSAKTCGAGFVVSDAGGAVTEIDTESPEYKAYVAEYLKIRAAKLATFPKTEFLPCESFTWNEDQEPPVEKI